MTEAAAVSARFPRMLTFTFTQPYADGEVPARHALCDPWSHIYEYRARDGSVSSRWRLLSGCKHCCRYVTGVLVKFRKRLRRLYGEQVNYLWAREDHPKSGAIHVHSLWIGLPQSITRKTRSGRRLKAVWAECGGGFLDLGYADADAVGRRVGWYVGKYLAKRHDQKMARGYRRWSRTKGFAPHVLMQERYGDPKPWIQPELDHELLGWEHPLSLDVQRDRVWLTTADLAPG